MLIETLEILDNNLNMTIEELTSKVNSGSFDDILVSCNFLIMTNVGLVLVKRDKSIILNAGINLSNYVEKENDKSLVLNSEIEKLSSIKFTENGELQITINNETKMFSPITI